MTRRNVETYANDQQVLCRENDFIPDSLFNDVYRMAYLLNRGELLLLKGMLQEAEKDLQNALTRAKIREAQLRTELELRSMDYDMFWLMGPGFYRPMWMPPPPRPAPGFRPPPPRPGPGMRPPPPRPRK